MELKVISPSHKLRNRGEQTPWQCDVLVARAAERGTDSEMLLHEDGETCREKEEKREEKKTEKPLEKKVEKQRVRTISKGIQYTADHIGPFFHEFSFSDSSLLFLFFLQFSSIIRYDRATVSLWR